MRLNSDSFKPKILDFYIIKKFLGTFFYAIALIIIVVIVFDVSEKIDDFLDNKAPLYDIIFVYYLNFIPNFVNLFSPLFTFIAVIYFTARLANNSEIVAVLSSGVSFNRLLAPYIVSALILGGMSFYLSNFLIPIANQYRLEFENTYVNKYHSGNVRNIHRQISPGEFVYVESFNWDDKSGRKFTWEKIGAEGMFYKMSAEMVFYDTLKNTWKVQDYSIRKIDRMVEELSFGWEKDTIINMIPNDFKTSRTNVDIMGYRELRDFIEDERLKGTDNVAFYEVSKHKRVAFPFATVVLTLIGVSLSTRKLRGGLGLHLAFGILISFAFILFMQISTTFAMFSNLSPLVSVWIPNVLFIVLGLYLLKTAPK